jgi:lipopolysaccharide biosynthesis glycosyltransferase
MMDTMYIVLACDDSYAQHLAVAAASILKHTAKPGAVCIYVLSDGISVERQQAIRDTIQALGGTVVILDVNSQSIQGFVSGHLSKAAYLRLQIPELLPEKIEKAIYLDTDVVVLDDIAKLWNIDLAGKPIGAVCDYGIMASQRMQKQKQDTLGLPAGQGYFNSGMLVMDLRLWRQQHYCEQVLTCISEHQFRHHDQDGLNKVFMDNWQEIPLPWNVIPPVFCFHFSVLKQRRFRYLAAAAVRKPAIFHWAGRYKPWEFPESGIFNESYYKYLHETAFRNASMPQPGNDMKGKSVTRQLVRMKMAGFWAGLL